MFVALFLCGRKYESKEPSVTLLFKFQGHRFIPLRYLDRKGETSYGKKASSVYTGNRYYFQSTNVSLLHTHIYKPHPHYWLPCHYGKHVQNNNNTKRKKTLGCSNDSLLLSIRPFSPLHQVWHLKTCERFLSGIALYTHKQRLLFVSLAKR